MNTLKNTGKIIVEQRKSLMTFSFCLVLLVLFQVSVPAQAQPVPTPPKISPRPRPTPRTPVATTPTQPAATPEPKTKRKVENTSEGPAEKSIAVDEKVNISLCVSSGALKVNGWDRNEIRAYVDGGSSVGFKVLQADKINKKAAWVKVLGFDPQKNKEPDLDECLEGKSIELDVPFGATINVKSKESEISVDSVGKVRIENGSGGINLRNITQGVPLAKTFEGDITVEEVRGPVNLFTSVGKIIVYDAGPNEIGEVFRAQSRSGAISLQNVAHTDLEVSSTTGSLRFTGALEEGGQYKFNTISGSIVLALQPDVSCKVTATYGGYFETQISFKEILHDIGPNGIHKILALIGTGEAALTVTTYNGSILIKPNKK
jgi:DUF4097 and DUF4098 domain-containing protein YvlB